MKKRLFFGLSSHPIHAHLHTCMYLFKPSSLLSSPFISLYHSRFFLLPLSPGRLYGTLLHQVFPSLSSPAAYALVGAASLAAGTTRTISVSPPHPPPPALLAPPLCLTHLLSIICLQSIYFSTSNRSIYQSICLPILNVSICIS